MKRLYLLRHSKSSWDDMSLRDFDRPLNKRGYKESKEIAQYIKDQGYMPDIILCSPSKRTRDTLDPILKAIQYDQEVIFLDSIYESHWTNLKEEVDKRTEEEVMLIGHCPGIEEYLSHLLGQEKIMKTCHLAVIEDGKLIDFIRPKDLR